FKKEDGQAVVELAITLPILIMILCAIIDFGWIFTNQNIIDNASREGARYAIVHSTNVTAIETYTKSVTPANIRNNLTVTVTFSNPSNPRQGDVTVVVAGGVTALTPIVGVFTQGEIINLDSSCTMKVE
ncbi:MAG: pilus assembly protein, partial [Eubacteriaceae bacterium]|nr:pilus assembly protein [Eubacteriaceae bacterium]